MIYNERGKIEYKNRGKQLVDYSGLRYGNKTPTDVDGYLDFGGKCAVVLEFKLKGKDVPVGQRIALETFADGVCFFPVLVIVADHSVYDSKEEIKADSCIVREYYDGVWHPSERTITVRQFVDQFVREHVQ